MFFLEAPMIDSSDWFVASGKSPVGPLTLDMVEEKIFEGTLTSTTKVWHKELGAWTHAGKVPETASLIDKVRLEKATMPKWMVVVDKKIKRDTEGPYSENEVEEKFSNQEFSDRTIFWTKGQEKWLPMSQIIELKVIYEKVLALRSSLPPEIDQWDDHPEIPDDHLPPPLHDDEETSLEHEALVTKNSTTQESSVRSTLGKLRSSEKKRSPESVLSDCLEDVFLNSKWLPTARIIVLELSKGIESGDSVKIDGVVEKLRLFLLNEASDVRCVNHPNMNSENLKRTSDALLSLVVMTEVKNKIEKFDPFFSMTKGAPSITATRTRALLSGAGKSD